MKNAGLKLPRSRQLATPLVTALITALIVVVSIVSSAAQLAPYRAEQAIGGVYDKITVIYLRNPSFIIILISHRFVCGGETPARLYLRLARIVGAVLDRERNRLVPKEWVGC